MISLAYYIKCEQHTMILPSYEWSVLIKDSIKFQYKNPQKRPQEQIHFKIFEYCSKSGKALIGLRISNIL